MADIVFTYNGKRVSPSSGKVLGKKALPALAPRSMRFDFKYDHFDPTTGLNDLSGQGFIWTHVSGDVYDFHYDNADWGVRTTTGIPGGLFNVYAYYNFFWMYPMAQHQFDILDMDLTGVTTVAYLFNSAQEVQNIFSIRNTSSVTDFNYFLGHDRRGIAITSIPLFDTSSATNMANMFRECKYLTYIPLFNTGNVTNVEYMFSGCLSVESGALSLYQQMSTQTAPPTNHTNTFSRCGSGTVTGAAELAQIPTSWGGTMAE